MTIDHYITIEPIATPELIARMKSQPKPAYLFDIANRWGIVRAIRRFWAGDPVKVPDNLNHLTYGDLLDLQKSADIRDFLLTACRVVLGVDDPRRVLSAPAETMIGFANWVAEELKRIDDLFRAIERPLTSEQMQAGYGSLNFGAFGTLDWYAKRMGIVNHDFVLTVSWLTLYQVKRNDSKLAECEERYTKIMQAKNERRGRK